MHTLLLLVTLFLSNLSQASFAERELEPFINFLRSTPAFITGSVYFNSGSVLYEEGWSNVKIVANEKIDFTFQEDYLQVTPGAGFYVQYAGFRVYVKSVTWTPAGLKSVSEMKADFTGLSSSTVSQGVSDTLEKIFGPKLSAANALLKKIRAQHTLGSTFTIAKTIVGIFTKGSYGSGTNHIFIPKYRGDINLNFLPPQAKAFNLYGMRVGIKEQDYFKSGFKFTGDTNGIYPFGVTMDSRSGVDFNTGKEFKAMMRLVLSSVSIDARGINLQMHLGATEVITGLLSLAELAASTRGPVKHCSDCDKFAELPSVRLLIERKVRMAIMSQIDELWPQLQNLNIRPEIYQAFKKHEMCRVTALSCMQICSRNDNNEYSIKSCKQSCEKTLNMCLSK